MESPTRAIDFARIATTVALVAPRPANGARANVAEVVPRFFASGSQEGARGWSSAKGVQPQPRHEELCLNAQGVRDVPRLRPTVVDAHRSRSVMTTNG